MTTRPLRASYDLAGDYNHVPLCFPSIPQANNPSCQLTTPFSWTELHWAHACPIFVPFLSLIVYTPINGQFDIIGRTVRAVQPHDQPHPPRVDEQGLPADYSDNARAETHSLRSNTGRGRKRKSKSSTGERKNEQLRRIPLFGFDLSGRPPIQLPDDGADNAPLFRPHRSSTPTTTLTTQTFDSDAGPLDISTIQKISVSKATEAAEAEAKRLEEKEERRQRRKARKEMKRLGVVGDGEEFEGFQRSGGLASLKRPSGAGTGGGTTATSSWGSHSRSQSHSLQSREGFGHFVSAPPPSAEDDVEDAYLDGSLYARKKSKSTNGVHSIGGTSNSRHNHFVEPDLRVCV